MNDLMRRYPSEDEYAAREWPDAHHDRYFYQVRLEFDADMDPADAAEFENLLKALHQVTMWNGYSADVSAEDAVQAGRTGVSYEIEINPRSISYVVERPACNPAIAIVWFWRMAESRLGRPAQSSEIFVTAED